ncbi:DUF4097 family beta strand repeat-containing protein [Microbacterium sp. BK668]|uniref:DUF4097 family beta strand repeat-containing protein n=1 Tax=Microbacterium sp. BK668 TaxID=2512118 RepID=UPI00105CDDF9|nr:DUF4097 family beta strand repeat-containing protein [Microbacterium sp. BK668]TDN91397.1 putative adhesin [Microbacterium sp. BK668]
MSTTMTPPPAEAQTPPPAGGPTRQSSRVVAILVIVLGALIAIGAMVSAVFSTVAAASVRTTVRTIDVADVGALDVDVAAGSLRIEYADVQDAELEVTGANGADRWTLRTDGDELVVSSPDTWFGDGWSFGGWPFGERGAGEATLRLPDSLAGADADLSLAGGELVVDEGEYGRFQLDMSAGRARAEASVDAVDASVAAGSADLAFDGAREASFSLSAGSLQAELTGAQPRSVQVSVSAGSLDLVVPEGAYDVQSDVSAGDFDNRIGSDPDADSTVTVQVSAGRATLDAG